MGGLIEKYQNNVLHGNMNMAPLNEFSVSFMQISKCQYVQICVSDLYVQIYVSKTLSN